MNNTPWYLDALKQGIEAAENMNIHPDLKQAAIDQGIRPAGYDSQIEEIDVIYRVVVNGKVYLAADKMLEIIDMETSDPSSGEDGHEPMSYAAGWMACGFLIKDKVLALKEGEQE